MDISLCEAVLNRFSSFFVWQVIDTPDALIAIILAADGWECSIALPHRFRLSTYDAATYFVQELERRRRSNA